MENYCYIDHIVFPKKNKILLALVKKKINLLWKMVWGVFINGKFCIYKHKDNFW